jgi:hypothetical protein
MKTHKVHESFMDYKEDMRQVIQLIESETHDSTNAAQDNSIAALIRRFRHQQKLTQIGDGIPLETTKKAPPSSVGQSTVLSPRNDAAPLEVDSIDDEDDLVDTDRNLVNLMIEE